MLKSHKTYCLYGCHKYPWKIFLKVQIEKTGISFWRQNFIVCILWAGYNLSRMKKS